MPNLFISWPGKATIKHFIQAFANAQKRFRAYMLRFVYKTLPVLRKFRDFKVHDWLNSYGAVEWWIRNGWICLVVQLHRGWSATKGATPSSFLFIWWQARFYILPGQFISPLKYTYSWMCILQTPWCSHGLLYKHRRDLLIMWASEDDLLPLPQPFIK